MDAKEFLNAVIPWDEGYATIHWHRPGGNFLGRSCQSIDSALALVAELTATTQHNIYFCLSRQRQNAGQRSRANALWLQAIWLDVDIDPNDPTKYHTLEEAITAVFQFCDLLEIPYPSIIVWSGSGLHCYWLSDHKMPVNEWQPYADALKTAAKNSSLKFDAPCTGDAARVLRVPGTLNYKYDPPQPVELIQEYCNGTRHNFAVALAKLMQITPHGSLGPVPAAFAGLQVTNLGAGIHSTIPLMPFEPIKEACGWLREAYETGGKNYDQPQWNLTTLCATFLEDGNALAHKFSDQHSGYDFQQTEALWDRKNRERRDKDIGWPKCRTVSDNGSKHCSACPHFASGQSPLHLGLSSLKTPKDEEIKLLGGDRPEDLRLPEGFCLNKKGRICAIVPGKKLAKGAGYTSARLLELSTNIIRNPSLQYQEGQFCLAFESSTDLGSTHMVLLSSSNCYAPGLFTNLAGKCVLYNADNEAKTYMQRLAYSWLDRLRSEQKALRDSGTLGWRNEGDTHIGFVYGGVIHQVDGTTAPVTNTTDDEFRRWYMPRGSKEPWLVACKLLTGRKRPELDILIAIAFAAPLMIFAGNVYGCILSCYGEPGTSKSTAQQVAAAVWGHPKQTRESLNSTAKSVQGRLGRTKNLAAYWDDIQDERHQENLFQTMFVATGGTEGGRLNSDSSYKERKEWQTLLVACSNASFVEFLIKKQRSTTAGMRRVLEFEYNRNNDEPGMVDELDANKAFAALEHNYGMVGAEYAQMITREHDKVDRLVTDVTRTFKQGVNGTADESFWWNMAGTLIAGAHLANKLGADLDVKAMAKFLTMTFLKNRRIRSGEGTEGGTFSNTEQSLAKFLIFQAGSGHVIYTDVTFVNKEHPVHILRYPGPGKPIYIHVIRDERKIIVSKRKFREYLQDFEIQPRQVIDGLARHFQTREVKLTLGAGTGFGVAQESCLEIIVPPGKHFLEEMLNAHGEPKNDDK